MPHPADTPVESTAALDPTAVDDLCRLMDGLDTLDRLLRLPASAGADGDVPLGRFRLRRRVGAGRHGVVFLADDPAVGRRVAVKVPQPAVLADPELKARFVREAVAAGRLDHPGVVPVFEAGEQDGLAFQAAGYVDGPTLAEWLLARGRPVDARAAARVVGAMAAAVHHAHERGVLHLDLKPANVLLDGAAADDPGEPRVADFGLARLVEGDPALTRTWAVAGTPLYMAPEQAAGDRRGLTARADVYALGGILHELLTGRPAGVPGPPGPAVPNDLAAVCGKCLEADPAARYGSAAEVAADLGRYAAGRPVLARAAGPAERLARTARRHPLLAGLAACVAGLVVALAVVLVRQVYVDLEHDLELKAADQANRAERFHAGLARVRARRAEPYSGWADDTLAELRELYPLRPSDDHLPEMRSEAAAALASLDLRPVQVIGEGFKPYAPAYSPDGRTLALVGWHADPDGRVRVRLYDADAGGLLRELSFPTDPAVAARTGRVEGGRLVGYSPDGRWLVAAGRGGELARWDLRDPDPRPVVWAGHSRDEVPAPDTTPTALAFAADGRTVYTSTHHVVRGWDTGRGWAPAGVWAATALARGVRPAGPVPVLHGPDPSNRELVRLGRPGKAAGPSVIRAGGGMLAVSPDGRLAAVFPNPGGNLTLVGLTPGGNPRPLVRPGRAPSAELPVKDLGFSPDGTVLVTAGEHDRRVKLWDVAAGALAADRPVGEGSGRFAFSPDGRRLAVAEDHRAVVYERPASVRETVAVGPHGPVEMAAVAADGRTVTTFQRLPNGRGLEVVTWDGPDARDRRPVVMGWADAEPAAAAPDGRGVAWAGHNGRFEVVIASPGGEAAADRVSDLRYGPDGRLWAADAHKVRVWTIPGWSETVAFENDPQAAATGMVARAVAPGMRHTLVGRRDGRVFRLAGPGGGAASWAALPSPVTAIALSPDETRAVVGGEGGRLALLDPADGRVTPLPDAHRDDVRSVAFGPAGWFVTGSADGTAKVWAADGRPVLTLRAGGDVRTVAVDRTGDVLTVLVDGERGLRRWRLDLLRAGLDDLGLGGGGW